MGPPRPPAVPQPRAGPKSREGRRGSPAPAPARPLALPTRGRPAARPRQRPLHLGFGAGSELQPSGHEPGPSRPPPLLGGTWALPRLAQVAAQTHESWTSGAGLGFRRCGSAWGRPARDGLGARPGPAASISAGPGAVCLISLWPLCEMGIMAGLRMSASPWDPRAASALSLLVLTLPDFPLIFKSVTFG